MNFQRYCEDQVRASDKDRFLATLFAPADKRGPLFALYAFNLEIAGVRDRVREPMAGEIRLQWWRDVLTGERVSEAAANPERPTTYSSDGLSSSESTGSSSSSTQSSNMAEAEGTLASDEALAALREKLTGG